MAIDIDLPVKGVDDGHWDQKLNAAMIILRDAINDASNQITNTEEETNNALNTVAEALATNQDALSIAQAAQDSYDGLNQDVQNLSDAVSDLQSLVGAGAGSSFPMFAIGDIARPTSDPTVQVFWTHDSVPANMLDGDAFLNLPDGVTI